MFKFHINQYKETVFFYNFLYFKKKKDIITYTKLFFCVILFAYMYFDVGENKWLCIKLILKTKKNVL